MNRVTRWRLIAIAAVAGIFCGELALRSVSFRDQLGVLCGRGHLLALIHGRGIYDADVDRALRESDYLSDIQRTEAAPVERRSALNKLIATAVARSRAHSEKNSTAQIEHELDLLGYQFPNARIWRESLARNHISVAHLSQTLGNDLRTRQWIEEQIAHDVDVGEEECHRFYNSHPEKFFVPERLHVNHIFLAAPPETAPEIVEAKRKAIEALSVRLGSGEDFAALAAESSEDEATKLNGGDLGYFSIARMPPDFFGAAAKLHPAETSQPVQTRLGFHLIRLIDTQPAHQRTFDEARNDIAVELANQKRVDAVRKLVVDLSSQASFLRSL
jgi:parvulin-like peptidyl-prolyl isomerase